MINNVVLTGRLTRDPDLKVTQSGTSVTSFTIANETGYGEHKKTNFINVVTWRKTAEFVANYFKKGNAIGVCGTIQTRDYEKDGRIIYITEVVANEVHFIEGKKSDNSPAEQSPQADISDFQFVDDIDLPFN